MKKNTVKLRWSLLLLIGALFTSVSCEKEKNPDESPVINEDAFSKDASGWKIVGDAQGGYIEPTYFPDGGVSGGYIFAKDDVAGGVWYFAAPASYRGNKSKYYGAKLSYSLFQDSKMSNQFESKDIIFKSDGKEIYYLYESKKDYPSKEWTPYSIAIDARSGRWFTETDEVASEAYMKEVLAKVTDFWIRGEFESGADEGGLDDVLIK